MNEDRDLLERSEDRDLLERSANRMELVSRWADDLAHEIKNPLHAMVINLELVKRRAAAGGDPEPAVQRAEVVERELHRVHALVESLLRLIRPWPLHPAGDVQDVFSHLLPVIAARCHIRKIDFDHEGATARVRLPPGDTAQVLLNLIDHAIEATPPGGSLRTRCTSAETGVVVTIEQLAPPESDEASSSPASAEASSSSSLASSSSSSSSAGDALHRAVVDRILERAGGRLLIRPSESGPGTRVVLELPHADFA